MFESSLFRSNWPFKIILMQQTISGNSENQEKYQENLLKVNINKTQQGFFSVFFLGTSQIKIRKGND